MHLQRGSSLVKISVLLQAVIVLISSCQHDFKVYRFYNQSAIPGCHGDNEEMGSVVRDAFGVTENVKHF